MFGLFLRCRLSGPGDTCTDCKSIVVKARDSKTSTTHSLQHSAKTRKIIELLKETEERSGGEEKTIIFSQFTTMLDIIEPFLRDEGFKFVRCKRGSALIGAATDLLPFQM